MKYIKRTINYHTFYGEQKKINCTNPRESSQEYKNVLKMNIRIYMHRVVQLKLKTIVFCPREIEVQFSELKMIRFFTIFIMCFL